MRDPSSRWRLPARPLTAAALSLALLGVGLALGFAGDEPDPRSRTPFRDGATPSLAGDRPPVLRPADLARAAAHAPPAIAALYRGLAEANPEAMPPYEEQALKQIEQFLQKGDTKLSLRQQLRAAEVALEAVLRFSLSARDRPLTGANPWADLDARLRRKLLDVRRRQLRALAASAHDDKGWAEALAYADRLLQRYPRAPALLVEAARVRTAYAGFQLLLGDYAAARRQLEWLEEHGLGGRRLEPLRVGLFYRPDGTSIRGALKHRAETLLQQARGLTDDGEAVLKLREARAAWPRLHGLQDYLLKRQHAYHVLYVGVPSLPEFLSPAAAVTDPERQAVELLFEGLVQERYDDAQGERYVAQLADGRPAALPGGALRFALDRQAAWSSGEPVTAKNVRDTVLLLRRTGPGRTQEWLDLVEEPVLEDDPFHIDFKPRVPYFDPLAPLTFKVLPPRADDPEFARQPVGSGPYRYAGRRDEDGRTCAVFIANPYYVRHGHTDRPYIREIRFYVPDDPAREFRDPARPLHLLLDLPTGRLKALQAAGVKGVRTLRNRRVYFLAVNHRITPLQDASVRRALAHALNRERILAYRFRGGEAGYRLLAAGGGPAALALRDLRPADGAAYHRPVNGPYPAGSWAVSPPRQVPAELHDRARAVAFARKAAEKHKMARPTLELTLKYPAGDAAVARACHDIAAQLAEVGEAAGWPVRVRPEALQPRALHAAVLQHDYQLAYTHIDYDSEAYWLWPLFDSRPEALQPGGSNFLGYEDATLEGLFRQAMARREFAEVRKKTHDIHARLYETMPLIPLWQLDTHLAVHPALRPTFLNPLRIFDDVANWKLAK
jgi:ABC-type transport system substrate-binding protein